MITCHSKYLIERCLQRGYALDEVMSCVISQDGDMWTIDTYHPTYPRERVGILSFKCVKDCTTPEFPCDSGQCCVELPDGTNECQDCKCICDPSSGKIPSDDPSATVEACKACEETWYCDSQSGPTKNSNGWYGPIWSTTGPTLEQVEQTCKEAWDCYGGCYGSWSDYDGQFSSLKSCEDECVDRYYCQGWSPYGGDPCPSWGKDLYGEKNCDKCQIVGYQCDASYGKIPVYGDPNAPLPGGLMSESDQCYQTYLCDSNSKCVPQGFNTTGNDEAVCASVCQTVAWRCDQWSGPTQVYGAPGTPPGVGEYPDEASCKAACLQRYECYTWDCYPSIFSTDASLPESCEAMDCVPRYVCNGNSGCQSSGYGKTGFTSCSEFECDPRYSCDQNTGCVVSGYGPETTGTKSCDDTVCVPSYNCNNSSGCVAVYDGSGEFGGITGAEALDACEQSCLERFECKSTGCTSTGYGTTGQTNDECFSACDVKCISESFFVSGIPSGNCQQVPYGTKTITVPSGIVLPVQVTISGDADDDFLVDGVAVPKNTPYGACNGAGPFPDYTFTLNQSTFTIAAADNHGGNTAYIVTICFGTEA